MNIIDRMIEKKIEALFEEVEALANDMAEDGKRKYESPTVNDLVNGADINPDFALRVFKINMQIMLLKGFVDASE